MSSIIVGQKLSPVFIGDYLNATAVQGGMRLFSDCRQALPRAGSCDVEVTRMAKSGSVAFVKVTKYHDNKPSAYLLGWNMADEWPVDGKVVRALIREGRETKFQFFTAGEAVVRGCPSHLHEAALKWEGGVTEAVNKQGEYHPLGDNPSLVTVALMGYEGENLVKAPLLQIFRPKMMPVQGELAELEEQVLICFVASANGLAQLANFARLHYASAFACGTWGNGRSTVSYRALTDPAFCTQLDVRDNSVLPSGLGGVSYREMLYDLRPKVQEPLPPNQPSWPCTYTTSHGGWLRLADKPTIVCQYRDFPPIARIGLDTSLEKPVQEENIVFVPRGWGCTVVGARGLVAEAEKPGQVFYTEGGAVFTAPYGATFQAKMVWNAKNGGEQLEYRGPMKIEPWGFSIP